jgi:tripartite-type tricarboxylate transporter receptor subunit TctC
MKRPRRKFLDPAVGALALLVISFGLVNDGALAQAGRTIKLIVPLPPGGGADILARILAEQIARAQGPTVVVENRPGAGTAFGEHTDGNGVAIGQLDWRRLESPEIRAKLAIQGFSAVGICGSDFGSFLRAQYDEYGRVIREANIKE